MILTTKITKCSCSDWYVYFYCENIPDAQNDMREAIPINLFWEYAYRDKVQDLIINKGLIGIEIEYTLDQYMAFSFVRFINNV